MKKFVNGAIIKIYVEIKNIDKFVKTNYFVGAGKGKNLLLFLTTSFSFIRIKNFFSNSNV